MRLDIRDGRMTAPSRRHRPSSGHRHFQCEFGPRAKTARDRWPRTRPTDRLDTAALHRPLGERRSLGADESNGPRPGNRVNLRRPPRDPALDRKCEKRPNRSAGSFPPRCRRIERDYPLRHRTRRSPHPQLWRTTLRLAFPGPSQNFCSRRSARRRRPP